MFIDIACTKFWGLINFNIVQFICFWLNPWVLSLRFSFHCTKKAFAYTFNHSLWFLFGTEILLQWLKLFFFLYNQLLTIDSFHLLYVTLKTQIFYGDGIFEICWSFFVVTFYDFLLLLHSFQYLLLLFLNDEQKKIIINWHLWSLIWIREEFRILKKHFSTCDWTECSFQRENQQISKKPRV